MAVGILAVFAIKGLCDYAGNYLVNYVGLSAVTDLRQDVFDRVVHQDAHFFEANSTARVMSSIMNDLEKIQVAMSHILADLLRQSFTALALLCVVLQTDWKLALVSLTRAAVRAGADAAAGTPHPPDHAQRAGQRRGAESGPAGNAQRPSGGEIVRRRGDRIQPFPRPRRAPAQQQSALCRAAGDASPLIEFFGAITIVGLLTYARIQIKAGTMSTGEFTSFVIALLMLYEPVKRLTGIHNIFQQALGASQKVFEYLDRDQQIKEKPGAARLARFEKAIVFDNVNFRYPTAPDGLVLDDIDLEVKAGEVVALVGPSGAGKTTLANLVPRFYDVTGGRDPDRRQGCARAEAGVPARQDQHRGAGYVSVQRYGGRQHRLRPAARLARAGPPGRPRRAGRGIHPAHAGGLRHHHRRARREAERRPAAAAGDRPRAAQERARS